ncbi:3D domain-containing protein [Oceanobacillus sojae]|uniref:3D domain-containing protein n=1 Tax=Oceanobacillus sojae TaxID=582851 RepID=UPI0009887DA4|nr:3D domain-containing protein [Oceanobacillus sojae]
MEWESGGLSASLTAIEEEEEVQIKAEKEAKELEENREVDSKNVRENDADSDSNGHGAGRQESGEAEDEGATEVPEETTQTAGEDVGTFEMTAYVAFCDTGCTGVTATGYDVSSTIYSPEGLRIVAADPGVLPFGTIIEITSGGNTFQAVVLDSGGDINGNRLDLLVESEAEALEYGRQDVDVRILGQ